MHFQHADEILFERVLNDDVLYTLAPTSNYWKDADDMTTNSLQKLAH